MLSWHLHTKSVPFPAYLPLCSGSAHNNWVAYFFQTWLPTKISFNHLLFPTLQFNNTFAKFKAFSSDISQNDFWTFIKRHLSLIDSLFHWKDRVKTNSAPLMKEFSSHTLIRTCIQQFLTSQLLACYWESAGSIEEPVLQHGVYITICDLQMPWTNSEIKIPIKLNFWFIASDLVLSQFTLQRSVSQSICNLWTSI